MPEARTQVLRKKEKGTQTKGLASRLGMPFLSTVSREYSCMREIQASLKRQLSVYPPTPSLNRKIFSVGRQNDDAGFFSPSL
jgi:hypothetical protein